MLSGLLVSIPAPVVNMYALNTFLRLTRFVANAFIGLIVGFMAGIQFGSFQALYDFGASFF